MRISRNTKFALHIFPILELIFSRMGALIKNRIVPSGRFDLNNRWHRFHL